MSSPELDGLHPCARCARMQKTCCQRAEVLVTLGDVRRIAERVGHARFHERRRPLDPEYLDQDADDPLWHRATVADDGTRRVLRRQPNGDCTFLGEAGCVLAEDVRPLVCRLYPFAYTEAGLADESADYCPTGALAPEGGSMARLLGMRRSTARGWHRMLYEELHAELAGR